ncbi:hypothetical protein FSP39_014652 [Pinctada imbricata]|uniref:chitin synthase n=1 Tax=Pinctada imbricata TaxID=66713 RepID=A0AA89C4Y5_PINIB|nr:hypothetical protein FSP39_014652 [Pinctada imbricata]
MEQRFLKTPPTKPEIEVKYMYYTLGLKYFNLTLAMCIPYVLIVMVCVWRSLFGNLAFPHSKTIVVVCVIECLHSIGLSLLVFRVLPKLDYIHGLMILSATCLLPSILKPICSQDSGGSKTCSSKLWRVCIFILDLIAIFIQISAVPVTILADHTKYSLADHEGKISNLADLEIAELVGALVLVSFSWWENFVDDRLCGRKGHTNSVQQGMLQIKFDLQESRSYIFMFVGFVKIVATCVTAWLLQFNEGHLSIDFSDIFDAMGKKGLEGDNLYLMLLALCSYLGYYIAYTACKLKMQAISFCLPLILSTPVAVLVMANDCEEFFSNTNDIVGECHDLKIEWYHYLIGLGWLVSVYWIGRYIWAGKQERLAKVERLFMNPLYCSVLLEQHLILNRRRHNRRIVKEQDDKGGSTFRLSDADMRAGNNEEDEKRDITIPPMIYACATMWHENRQEMVQILKSLYRMDKDQFMRRQAYEMSGNVQDTEYYEFEVHILFDDAFEINDDEEMVPNDFVKMFCSLQVEAASSVYSKPMTVSPPLRIPSPYGGQLVFKMPGNNLMFVHLKDKVKIRHRKRWSQVMYMYYLLGYRIVKECQERVMFAMENNKLNELASWGNMESTGLAGRSQIFKLLDDEVIYRAENTFLLALDGDVDFTPGAVRLLMDRMYKNLKVGASCGRIHPIGRGPMVWYQKFEYATAHWLQKATEHVLGCVLCSPGCFSLFRGSALMDDNIMRKYTIMPTEASHHLMYDQGEDRWLCTLLLQQGYRVDYAAASDAYTYAPEAFDEFFNQRRRWMPSTIANIMDLLQDGKNTVAINNNISWLYIFYQAALMVSCIIGPSTVLMMIAGALLTVFNIDLLTSYIISLAPALFFFVICFIVKTRIQILIAEVLSAVYTFIMMVVLVGAIITAVQESPAHPSVIFLAGLVLIFLLAGLFHPREWSCIIYGVLYFMWVPTGFLLLVLYSLCNLHVVSWGTREVPKKKTKKELEEEAKRKKEEEEKKKQGWFARTFGNAKLTSELKDFLKEMPGQNKKEDKMTELLVQLNDNIKSLAKKEPIQDDDELQEVTVDKTEKKSQKKVTFRESIQEKEFLDDEEEYMYQKAKRKRNELVDPAWTECKELGDGDNIVMNQEECRFWEGFIGKYLYPLDAKNEEIKQKNKEAATKLIELRNNICAGMAMINLLWLAINFMFQLRKPTVVTLPSPIQSDDEDVEVNENVIKVDILGLGFVIFFLVILLIQFTGMIVHRWGTFLHLIAITEIPNPFRKKKVDPGDLEKPSKERAKEALEVCSRLMAEPLPDYSDDDDEEMEMEERENLKQQIFNLSTTGTRDNLRDSISGGGFSRSIRTSRAPGNSYSDNLRSEAGRQHTMADQNFRDTVSNFLRQSRNEQLYPGSTTTETLRRRTQSRENSIEIGQTLPSLGDEKKSAPRKFGTGTPYQRDFMDRIERSRGNLAERYNMTRNRAGNMGATGLGVSFRRDALDDIDENYVDDDDIYDEIPAAKMGTLGRQFAKKLVRLERRGVSRQNGTISRSGKRHSGIVVSQWENFGVHVNAKQNFVDTQDNTDYVGC